MNKIRITEKQAKLLGLKKLNEEEEISGSKKFYSGPKPSRLVISGKPLEKEFIIKTILSIIKKYDKNSDASYNPLTNKIVSKKTNTHAFDKIIRDLKSINTGESAEPRKEGVGGAIEILINGLAVDTAPSTPKIKITKEQYDRIFASGLINEAMDPTDKQFRKEFAGSDIENLEEDKFNIQDKNPSLPSSIQGKFGKPLMETDDDLRKETKDLIKYFYRKSDKFSPFWDKYGLTYDDIQDALKTKGLVVTENGMCEISKKIGTPEEAINAIQEELKNLITKEINVSEQIEGGEIVGLDILNHEPFASLPETKADVNFKNKSSIFLPSVSDADALINIYSKEDISGANGYLSKFFKKFGEEPIFVLNPEGDWFNKVEILNPKFNEWKDQYIKGKGETLKQFGTTSENVKNDLDVVAYNSESAILKDKDNALYYSSKYGSNSNEMVKIDEKLKNQLLKIHDKDKKFVEALLSLSEEDKSTLGMLKGPIVKAATPKEKKPKSAEEIEKMAKNLADLYGKPVDYYLAKLKKEYGIDETTSAASSGAFTGPLNGPIVKKEMPVDTNNLDVPVVGETTTAASSGQYTAPAFNMKSHTEFSKKKPKAFKKTQYAGGKMVAFNDCVKLNNKPAGSGCSQGAVDNVVKLKNTSGNINAPSLGEETSMDN